MELHLREITLISWERTVVGCGLTRGSAEGRTIAVVIITADARSSSIGYQSAAIDTILVGAACNITIEHAVDNSCLEFSIFTT